MIGLSPQQALIAKLAASSPEEKIGRTALMKLCYLLQEVRGVPLHYRFTLYSYGPFDKAVLEDLGQAEALGAIEEQYVQYGLGYGYEIRSKVDEAGLSNDAHSFLEGHARDIDWVVGGFGGKSANELELLATIVYADHENASDGQQQSVESLATIVSGIKPKFNSDWIAQKIEELRVDGLLKAVQDEGRA